MPDLDNFARYLRTSANDLEAAVLPLKVAEEKELAENGPVQAKSTPFFEQMGQLLQSDPSLAPAGAGVFQFVIKGADPQNWVIDLNAQPGIVENGTTELADATFIIKDAHLMKVLSGELGMQIAFMQGKLKVKGDIGKALKLAPLLTKMPTP